MNNTLPDPADWPDRSTPATSLLGDVMLALALVVCFGAGVMVARVVTMAGR